MYFSFCVSSVSYYYKYKNLHKKYFKVTYDFSLRFVFYLPVVASVFSFLCVCMHVCVLVCDISIKISKQQINKGRNKIN